MNNNVTLSVEKFLHLAIQQHRSGFLSEAPE